MKRVTNILLLVLFTWITVNTAHCQRRRMRGGNTVLPLKSVKELDGYLQKLTSKQRFSGTVLVVQNKKKIFGKSFGYASKRFKVPNQMDTKFNIGSINKLFTTVAILQLIQKGKIKLSDKAVQYVPELSMKNRGKITIEHLIKMKSGLGFYWENKKYTSNWENLRNMEDYLAIIKDEELAFEPGTKSQYSNSGYELLGIIVQRVAKQDYYEYVKQHIYQVAGMNNTDSYDYDEVVENLAMGYTNLKRGEAMRPGNHGSGKGYMYNNVYRHSSKGTAAGGGYSTVNDFQKFGTALAAHKLLNKKWTSWMFNHFSRGKGRHIFVGGGAPGISAIFSFDADKGNTIVVLANYDGVSMPIAQRIQKSMGTMSK